MNSAVGSLPQPQQMQQNVIDQPLERSDRPENLCEGFRLISAAWAFWAVQFFVFCLELGSSSFKDIRPVLMGFLVAAAGGCCLSRLPPGFADGRTSDGRLWLGRVGVGAAIGFSLNAVQLLSIGSFSDGGWFVALPAIATALATLLGGAVTGAALAWAEPALAAGWGRAFTFLLAGSSFALSHLALVFGVAHRAASGGVLLAPVAFFFTAILAFVIGLMLRDTGRLASAEALARDERFRMLADAFPIPVALTSADYSSIVFSNTRWDEIFAPLQGHDTSAHAKGIHAAYAHADDQQRLIEIVRRKGMVENYEVEMRRRDGTNFWALASARSVVFDGQDTVLAGFYDITDRKLAEEALLASEVRYALIARSTNDGIFDWDIATGEIYYSPRLKEIIGAGDGGPIRMADWFNCIHPEDVARLKKDLNDHYAERTQQFESEYRLRHGAGHYCWMQSRGMVMRDEAGKPIRMAGSASDITLRKTYENNLLNAAYEDRLTGINNRTFFNQLIEQHGSEETVGKAVLLLLNVDDFRRLNDNLGSGAGDTLLVSLARRLTAKAGPRDALSRLGSDEFALWIGDCEARGDPRALAEALLFDLELPYALGDVEVPVTISAGLASYALGDVTCGEDLVRNARLALDRAKQLGGGRVESFENALLRETHLRRRLSRDLTNAERQGQISCVYQPIIKLDGHLQTNVAGFESLMRWQHPELGAIPPARFIPIAEEAGLIGPLGLFAIESAFVQIQRWSNHHSLPVDFAVSVNLSARQISDNAGVSRLLALLDRLELPKGRLKLEITESVLMSDPEAMVVILQQLRDRGIELSLDDFGTGYSSLSYLHRFPLDTLKIDRSFVSRMTRAQEAYRLVRSIIELAHDLGLKVVAEGVETHDEVDLLRGLGCDYGQGYYFSRPLHADQAEELLMGEAA